MVQFDWTISIANILTAAFVIGGWFYAFFQLKSDVRIVKHDMKNIMLRQELHSESLTQLTQILTKVAVQEERFNHLERRIEASETDIRDIQNGVGFRSENISGEYTRHGKITGHQHK